jgi:hypothetical protein
LDFWSKNMGKKSRRKAKLRAAARLAQGAPAQPVYQAKPMATQVAQPKAVAAPVQRAVMPALENRYQYVVPELQRIGIISGVLFAILIVLAIVLH